MLAKSVNDKEFKQTYENMLSVFGVNMFPTWLGPDNDLMKKIDGLSTSIR